MRSEVFKVAVDFKLFYPLIDEEVVVGSDNVNYCSPVMVLGGSSNHSEASPEAAAESLAAPVVESAAAAAAARIFDAAYFRSDSDEVASNLILSYKSSFSRPTSSPLVQYDSSEVGRENDDLHDKIKFDATYDHSFSKNGDNFIFCGNKYIFTSTILIYFTM